MSIDAEWVVAIAALLSSISRAGLNIIDRITLGMRRIPLNDVLLINSLLPSLFGVMICTWRGEFWTLAGFLLDWRTMIFAGVVYCAGYFFSVAFKFHNVETVIALSKVPDLVIAVVIFSRSGVFGAYQLGDIALAGLTTIACLGFLKSSGPATVYKLVLPGILIVQSIIMPIISPLENAYDFSTGLGFAVWTIIWRTVFSVLPVLANPLTPFRFKVEDWGLIFARTLLAVLTQVTFVFAVTEETTPLAWALITMSSVFSFLISRVVFRPKFDQGLQLILYAILATVFGRILLQAAFSKF